MSETQRADDPRLKMANQVCEAAFARMVRARQKVEDSQNDLLLAAQAYIKARERVNELTRRPKDAVA